MVLTQAFADRREEAVCGGLPRRARQGAALRRRPEPEPNISVECEPKQGLRQGLDVARLQEETLALILGQVWEVAGPPADNGQAESHRLAPDGPVRLPGSRKDEGVRRPVEACDVFAGNGAMRDDAAAEVGLREARPHACCVACVR
jgi:hypothetical protein